MKTIKRPVRFEQALRTCLTALLISTVGLSACDSDVLNGASSTSHSSVFGKMAESSSTTKSPVFTFDDISDVGRSVLRRYAEGAAISFSSTDLIPRYTYTLWWVVFDYPEACSPDPAHPENGPACGDDDVEVALEGGPNPSDVSILWAGDGGVAPASGKKNFRGFLAHNDASDSIFGDGLDNPETAELHQVLRSHGPAIPGLVREQISTFNGGCDPGQPNEGQCVDVQFTVHVAN